MPHTILESMEMTGKIFLQVTHRGNGFPSGPTSGMSSAATSSPTNLGSLTSFFTCTSSFALPLSTRFVGPEVTGAVEICFVLFVMDRADRLVLIIFVCVPVGVPGVSSCGTPLTPVDMLE
jgi:hypothetical protein